ncbi:MAG TPA: class III poly(R)-hydroxyalkanoic acid synthase subunit PhaC [Steroidobacteraceae bacterium]|nr:class III poly(R)-hydroxyalkanoic acid synthase subunit PhaC [Steroidobacteraceae bacterium]
MTTLFPDAEQVSAEMLEFARRAAATLPALAKVDDTPAGCSEKKAVWTDGKLTLYRYEPRAESRGLKPLLICYALVNRPYMMDLQPDRSLIRGLLEAGLDVYLIDWGYPDGSDRYTSLDDYINGFLDRCVQFVRKAHKVTAINLLGVCQGGAFSLCYTAMHPHKVRNLITMVTPVDFKTPDNLLSKWIQGVDTELMARMGNISGDWLNAAYLALMPFRLAQQKYISLVGNADDAQQLENFMRMERWIFDSPDQAATAFTQFVRWFYQENRFVTGGLVLGVRKVDLARIGQPVLNLYGLQDHLVPPSASLALQKLISSEDYTAVGLEVGHIGMYVSGRAQREVPGRIAQWLAAR